MRLLCSPSTWRHYGERLELAAPVEPLLVGTPGRAEVAWCSFDLWREQLVDAFFDQAEADAGLRWLHTSSAGLDRPVYARLASRGVRLTNAHVTGDPIADVVVRSVLDVLQDAGRWRRAQAAHRWEPHRFREVAGTSWLVVGVGAIGRGVARRARACGARVVGVRRRPGAPAGDGLDAVISPSDLGQALPEADVIVLSVPLTASTATMVDRRFLAALKPGAVLVNVGRGGLVDEDALLEGLGRGQPAAAILDVFRQEPLPPDSPWWDHPQVTVTPHSSALGHGSDERAVDAFCANLSRWVAGEPLEDEVGAEAFV